MFIDLVHTKRPHSVRSAMSVHSKLEIEEASPKRLQITQGSLVASAARNMALLTECERSLVRALGYKHGTPDGVRVLGRGFESINIALLTE